MSRHYRTTDKKNHGNKCVLKRRFSRFGVLVFSEIQPVVEIKEQETLEGENDNIETNILKKKFTIGKLL